MEINITGSEKVRVMLKGCLLRVSGIVHGDYL